MKSGGKAVKVKKHTAIAIMPITASSFRIGRGGGVVREKRYGKTCKHGEKEYSYIDCEY